MKANCFLFLIIIISEYSLYDHLYEWHCRLFQLSHKPKNKNEPDKNKMKKIREYFLCSVPLTHIFLAKVREKAKMSLENWKKNPTISRWNESYRCIRRLQWISKWKFFIWISISCICSIKNNNNLLDWMLATVDESYLLHSWFHFIVNECHIPYSTCMVCSSVLLCERKQFCFCVILTGFLAFNEMKNRWMNRMHQWRDPITDSFSMIQSNEFEFNFNCIFYWK